MAHLDSDMAHLERAWHMAEIAIAVLDSLIRGVISRSRATTSAVEDYC
jgi:hypothetical protein